MEGTVTYRDHGKDITASVWSEGPRDVPASLWVIPQNARTRDYVLVKRIRTKGAKDTYVLVQQ